MNTVLFIMVLLSFVALVACFLISIIKLIRRKKSKYTWILAGFFLILCVGSFIGYGLTIDSEPNVAKDTETIVQSNVSTSENSSEISDIVSDDTLSALSTLLNKFDEEYIVQDVLPMSHYDEVQKRMENKQYSFDAISIGAALVGYACPELKNDEELSRQPSSGYFVFDKALQSPEVKRFPDYFIDLENQIIYYCIEPTEPLDSYSLAVWLCPCYPNDKFQYLMSYLDNEKNTQKDADKVDIIDGYIELLNNAKESNSLINNRETSTNQETATEPVTNINDKWYKSYNKYSSTGGTDLEVIYYDNGSLSFAFNGLTVYNSDASYFDKSEDAYLSNCENGTIVKYYPNDRNSIQVIENSQEMKYSGYYYPQ